MDCGVRTEASSSPGSPGRLTGGSRKCGLYLWDYICPAWGVNPVYLTFAFSILNQTKYGNRLNQRISYEAAYWRVWNWWHINRKWLSFSQTTAFKLALSDFPSLPPDAISGRTLCYHLPSQLWKHSLVIKTYFQVLKRPKLSKSKPPQLKLQFCM